MESLIFCGAEDETRTRDPHLGKVMLYQLSYFRMYYKNFWECKYIGYRFNYPNLFQFFFDKTAFCACTQYF